jgi:hypothetical protein
MFLFLNINCRYFRVFFITTTSHATFQLSKAFFLFVDFTTQVTNNEQHQKYYHNTYGFNNFEIVLKFDKFLSMAMFLFF